MLVHPKPRRRISPNDWFEFIPARLRDLLMGRAFRRLHLRQRDHAMATIRQRLAISRDNRNAGSLLQPRVRHGHDRLQPETLDHHRRLVRWQSGIDQQRGAPFFMQHFVELNDCALARDGGVAGLLAQSLEEQSSNGFLNSWVVIAHG